ncbi:alpha/beta hydrolase [Acetonema longum]|uniref:Alpha/beta hydrolase fold protein n=1 Tax=Acetonema longum DSM 6540 TaxID=1009370 RepID=F7NJQ4_9FIRM|nr:alpha/beta fold hydrolase [Acetonema longum]EGO63710.1 alpha/beta hydrolase fold protein [Acetonema longum DSM 6540]
MAILKGAEPFLLPGGEHGILLVHGFTGSPSEMRLLGESLQKEGYTVLAPRLPGHGTSPSHMAQTRWMDWYGAVEDAYHVLRGLCREVSVAGLSMGGLLALKLAAEYPVKTVTALSAPIYIADKRLKWLPLYRVVRQYVPKRRRPLNVDPIYSVGYDRTPLTSLASLLDLIGQVDTVLPRLTAPLLIVQSKAEHTVCPRSAVHILERAGSREKKIVWLTRSGHIVTLDNERHTVFTAIASFLSEPEPGMNSIQFND